MPGGGVGSQKAGRGAESSIRPAKAGQSAPKPVLRAVLRRFGSSARRDTPAATRPSHARFHGREVVDKMRPYQGVSGAIRLTRVSGPPASGFDRELRQGVVERRGRDFDDFGRAEPDEKRAHRPIGIERSEGGAIERELRDIGRRVRRADGRAALEVGDDRPRPRRRRCGRSVPRTAERGRPRRGSAPAIATSARDPAANRGASSGRASVASARSASPVRSSGVSAPPRSARKRSAACRRRSAGISGRCCSRT